MSYPSCISATAFATTARVTSPVRLSKAAKRPVNLAIVGNTSSLDLPSLAPEYIDDQPHYIDYTPIKSPGLPIFLPEQYAYLTPLLQHIADCQGQDTTMPYAQTAAQLVIRQAFWRAGSVITDYTGHMIDADLRLARSGEQTRLISYNVHNAPALALGFHAVAVPPETLIAIKGACKNSQARTSMAIKAHCASHTPDVVQHMGDIVRRDELTAWGRTNKVIGDGQHHHFITVSFYLPHQQQESAAYALRKRWATSTTSFIEPRC